MATWQEKLKTYETDPEAAAAELLRAKSVYAQKQASGDTAGAEAAHTWADQVRSASPEVADSFSASTTSEEAVKNYSDLARTKARTETTYASTTPETMAVDDLTSQIDAMYEAQLESRINALSKARNTALSSLTSEQEAIAPQYQTARNSSASNKELESQRMAEYMAAQGATGNGATDQMRLSNSTAYQGIIAGLNTEEVNANSDIERRRTDVNSGYATDLATAQSDAEAAAQLANIQELQRVQQLQLDQYNSDRAYNLNEAGLTGTLNGQNTLAKQSLDSSNSQWEQTFGYQQSRDATTDSQWEQTFDYQQSRDATTDSQWQQSFDASLDQFEKNYGLSLRSMSLQEASAAIDAKYKMGQLSLSARNTALAEAQQISDQNSEASQQTFDNLMNTWQASGYAPAGLESYGVERGTSWAAFNQSGGSGSGSSGSSSSDMLDGAGLIKYLDGYASDYVTDKGVISGMGGAYTAERLQQAYDAGLIDADMVDWALDNYTIQTDNGRVPLRSYSTIPNGYSLSNR